MSDPTKSKSMTSPNGEAYDLRYLKFLSGRWRWCPTPAMKKHGFAYRNFTAILTDDDRKTVAKLNRDCDRARLGIPHKDPLRYSEGSIGWCWDKALKARALIDEHYERVRTKQELDTDHWHRAWKWLAEFEDRFPQDVTMEQLLKLRTRARKEVSEHEAYMVIKIWRAFWKKMAAMVVFTKADPSTGFANKKPDVRKERWSHEDVVTLVERSWEHGFYGMAAAIAVGWDALLASGDVRDLTIDKLKQFPDHTLYFDMSRVKTDVAGAGTLTAWSTYYFMEYMTWLRFEKHIDLKDNDPLFYTRGTCEPLPAATGETTTDAVMAVLADGPLDRAGLVRAVMARKTSATLKQIDSALYSLKSVSKRIFANGSVYRINPDPPKQRLRAYRPIPYDKDSFARDFRKMRALVFGEDDNRKFHDMRRTGGIEAIAGGAPIEAVADKLANSIDEFKLLQQTYTPVNLAAIRAADEARIRGRVKLAQATAGKVAGRDLLESRLPKLLPKPGSN